MGIREEIEKAVNLKHKVDPHHMRVHRVELSERHPVLDIEEEIARSLSNFSARAVAEDFHAKAEGRPMRPLDEVTEAVPNDSLPTHTKLLDEDGIEVFECAVAENGALKVVCRISDVAVSNPVFVVNPPVLVEDPVGDIEVLDESGAVVARYSENPTQALLDTLSSLRRRG